MRHDSVILCPARIKPQPEAVLSGLKAARDTMEEFPLKWHDFCESVAHLDDDARKKAHLGKALQAGLILIDKQMHSQTGFEKELLVMANRESFEVYTGIRQADHVRLSKPEDDKRIADLEARVASEGSHSAD